MPLIELNVIISTITYQLFLLSMILWINIVNLVSHSKHIV